MDYAPPAPPGLPPLVIWDERGGMITAYEALADRLIRSGQRVVIAKYCRSACTVFLSLPPGQICAMPDAEFWFHAATDSKDGIKRFVSEEGNAQFMRRYPPQIRAWLGERLTVAWRVLKGEEMRALVPLCRA